MLKPEINGVISKIYVEGGELVDKNAPLFEIDDRLFKSEVKDCEAKLKFATVELNRAKAVGHKQFWFNSKA